MSTFADLVAIVGPPTEIPFPIDWIELERAAGLSFPDDYKRLTEEYSRLKFDDFLGLAHLGTLPGTGERLAELSKALEPLRARRSA